MKILDTWKGDNTVLFISELLPLLCKNEIKNCDKEPSGDTHASILVSPLPNWPKAM